MRKYQRADTIYIRLIIKKEEKGRDWEYDRRNISMVICDADIPYLYLVETAIFVSLLIFVIFA